MIEWTIWSADLEYGALVSVKKKRKRAKNLKSSTIEWLNFQVEDHFRKSFASNNNIYRNYDNCNSTASFSHHPHTHLCVPPLLLPLRERPSHRGSSRKAPLYQCECNPERNKKKSCELNLAPKLTAAGTTKTKKKNVSTRTDPS